MGRERWLDAALAAVDIPATQVNLTGMNDRELRDLVNEAGDCFYIEDVMDYVAEGKGWPRSETTQPLHILGGMGMALFEGARRGIEWSPQRKRKLGRRLLTWAKECNAEADGKLHPIFRPKVGR